jgi:N-methylhydantoinase A
MPATVVGVTQTPALTKINERPEDGGAPPPLRITAVYIDGADRPTPAFQRDDLSWGHRFAGPALIQQYDSTVFVPPSFDVSVDAYGNLVGELRA